MVAMKIYF